VVIDEKLFQLAAELLAQVIDGFHLRPAVRVLLDRDNGFIGS